MRREKRSWLYLTSKRYEQHQDEILKSIEGPVESRPAGMCNMHGGGGDETGLLGYKHEPMSSLMFVPPGLPAPPNTDINVSVTLPVKQIKHDNTRLEPEDGGDDDIANTSKRKQFEHYGNDDGTHAHRYMRTPSPTPGESGDVPLMTWGGVAATPLVISGGGGPTFRMPDSDSNDIVAAQLTRKATASVMRKRAGETPLPPGSSVMQGVMGQTPLIGVASASSEANKRLSKLTPAAMNLLARQRGGAVATNTDTLRMSYGATPARVAPSTSNNQPGQSVKPVFAAGITPARK